MMDQDLHNENISLHIGNNEFEILGHAKDDRTLDVIRKS